MSSFAADPASPQAHRVALTGSVDDVLLSLTIEEQVGQLLCVYHRDTDATTTLRPYEVLGLKPGGFLISGGSNRTRTTQTIKEFESWSRVRPLIAANLESGTNTFITDGVLFASPMQVAATGNPTHARRLGTFCATQARAMGINWAFAPVIDIALNHRNPITNTRAFGSDPELVAKMGAAYITALQAGGVAAAAKHWPGDGVDDRDQHLLTSINSLGHDAWWSTFGRVYKAAIDAGVMTVMAAHIALPGYGSDRQDLRPATLSRRLLVDLLRDELGFTGMVVSDNNLMAGFTRVMPRDQAVVEAINAGCDMLLGSDYVAEDFEALLAATRTGALPADRLREAVTRVLTTKARLGLLQTPDEPTAELDRRQAPADGPHQWLEDVARQSITLVKDTDAVLPVNAARYRKILVYVIGDRATFYQPASGLAHQFARGLEQFGCEVQLRSIPGEGRTPRSERQIQGTADLVIYFANMTFTSESNTSRVRWSYPQGPDAPRWPDVPSMLVSVADPYHLQDMPSIGTAVNGYSPSPHTVNAILDCIAGRAEFEGSSPVDPFAGCSETRS